MKSLQRIGGFVLSAASGEDFARSQTEIDHIMDEIRENNIELRDTLEVYKKMKRDNAPQSDIAFSIEGIRYLRATLSDLQARLRHKERISNPSIMQPKERLRWLPKREPVYSLKGNKLKFVNRKNAIATLLEIHDRNHETRRNNHAGSVYRLGLIDNPVGTGKTEFSSHYISLLESSDKFSQCSDELKESLNMARTVIVRLRRGSFCHRKHFDDDVRDQFIRALEVLITDGELQGSPSFLVKNLKRTGSFSQAVERMIAETRTPLFIVFDEVGSAFADDSLSLVEQRDNFLFFCSEILGDTFIFPHLYLLLIGKGEFLSLVANRTPCSPPMGGSLVMLHRIGLSMIRRDYIGMILDETKLNMLPENNNQYLTEYFELGRAKDNIKRIQAIEYIVSATNGHPRSMLEMLAACSSLEDLKSYIPPAEAGLKNVQKWVLDLAEYGRGMQLLLDKVRSGETIDLTRKVFENLDKSLTLEQLADRAMLRYEGTTDKAHIHASKFIMRHLGALFLPLRSFLMQLDMNSEPKYKHEGNFELCFLRRFQEMFGREHAGLSESPGCLFPQWFGGTLFGGLSDFRLDLSLSRIPKITENGAKTFVSLLQASAVPELWPLILARMRSLPLPCSFLPEDCSASSDVYLVAKRERYDSIGTAIITVALAVKCIKKPLAMNGSRDSVQREQYLFNRIFERWPGASTQSTIKGDINVLIVCSSGGFAGVQFDPWKNVLRLDGNAEFSNIHETLLLDLSTQEKRADFFGISEDAGLIEKIEWMVSKGHLNEKGQTDNV